MVRLTTSTRSDGLMYKFIGYDEYKTSGYLTSHPYARVNIEEAEVVLSCNAHGDNCNCLTHKQALEHIDANWQKQT